MTPPVFVTADQVVTAASQLVGLAALASTLAAVVALGYRWLTREPVPLGLALLAGLSGVALYLNTTTVLGEVIEGEMDSIEASLFNIGAFLLGAAGALAGHRVGDAFGRSVIHGGERETVDEDVSRLVRTVGRVTTVTMPEHVEDVVGYDPASERTRKAIEGSQFVFPRNLTVSELNRRIRSRLKTDYGVGAVDLDLTDDGRIEHLAVGSRAAGIGPTLPPATNAVAIRSDPAFEASAGDVVQVWETDPMRRVLTGELRGVAGDVVTVAINSGDTPKVDPTRTYRLVTLPVDDRPAREFASLLRAADESYTSVTVEAGSPLHGLPVGALDIAVVAVQPGDGEPVALPTREHVLAPGEIAFVVAPPDALRTLERAAKPLDFSIVADTGTPAESRSEGEQTERTGQPGEATPSPVEPAEAVTDLSPVSGETDTESASVAGAEDGLDSAEAEGDGEPAPLRTGPEPSSKPDSPVAGKMDASSFEELKTEYDEGEDWDTESEHEDEPIERVVAGSDTDRLGEIDERSGDTSFEDLKAEFETDRADWDDTDDVSHPVDRGPTDEEPSSSEGDASESDSDATDEDDDLTSLTPDGDDVDDLFGDDPFGDDDLFEDDAFDGTDDSAGEDRNESNEETTDEDDESDDGDAEPTGSNDDSGDGGGGSTFAQLKEEFESGDAEWEDDVSDSPGGDMRLDE